MNENSAIAVMGAGSFGTSLAIALASNQIPVTLWGHNPDHLSAIQTKRENQRYLPGIKLPCNLAIEASLTRLVNRHQHFLLVVPSHAFRKTLENLKLECQQSSNNPRVISWGTKGFEPGSSQLLSEVSRSVFKSGTDFAAITGPSFARELACGRPTMLTVASDNPQTAELVASWLKSSRLRAYTNTDLIGTQVGGAVKNVMAIATGICDGLGLGANARAGLITRGLAELTRLGIVLGGNTETFMGLSGLGDLILTCTDDQSRNRRVGLGLGQGKTLAQTLNEICQEAEGVITTKSVHNLARKLDIEMPITEATYQVLYEYLDPKEAASRLLERQLKAEFQATG